MRCHEPAVHCGCRRQRPDDTRRRAHARASVFSILGRGLMATFVLVHGAWHGAWCWRRVARLLGRSGHEVFTPTLTGLAERSHLLTPEIGLDTHILDVANEMR